MLASQLLVFCVQYLEFFQPVLSRDHCLTEKHMQLSFSERACFELSGILEELIHRVSIEAEESEYFDNLASHAEINLLLFNDRLLFR